ncbi:uncharacterized protein EAE97_003536 [Botrytis byssoidea]|uniref:Uncharacterized protein n=1 Tax=Botrytis byssoidea TaxID=139641 RepID=A0A9P5IN81_9HELO|nr:uncharacterized protein EAE97_003536 [Botrytis byssoidea]KAF7948125.1 hypothetical protein EAE97_003536 [Botrytis byssoidea]
MVGVKDKIVGLLKGKKKGEEEAELEPEIEEEFEQRPRRERRKHRRSRRNREKHSRDGEDDGDGYGSISSRKHRNRDNRDCEDDENPRRHHSVNLSASTSRSPHTDYRRRVDDDAHSTSPKRHHSNKLSNSTSLSPHHARPSTGKSSKYTEEGVRAPKVNSLMEWPPVGFSNDAELSQGKAMQLIANGVPVFKGTMESIAHASDEYFALYATCNGNGGAGSDRAEIFSRAFMADSMRLQGPGEANRPWDSLEQPSMAFYYGTLRGTITLNHWCSGNGNPHAPIELRDSGVQTLRDVDLQMILDRLIYLEAGIDDESEDMLYKSLYKVLLKDLDKSFIAKKGMEKQIADLIIALSRREWIDFSQPKNHVVAKFFADGAYSDHGRYRAFFHQLLLSMELELRIQSKHHSEEAKERLLAQLPPWISWDLAVAKKWRECMTIEKYKTGDEFQQIKFRLLKKRSQVKALRKFARAMKWPNLAMVDEALKELDPDASPLEDRSADAMSFCTGLILPGPTQPWLLMNTLIDCDEDGGVDLGGLTHMYPNSGFQYRGSTYWASTSIVGKVLAPTCQEIAGWVGPALASTDIERTQVLRIRQRMTPQVITKTDVLSMRVRSDPLGPPDPSDPVYPVNEFVLPMLDLVSPPIDNIRIEKLAFEVAKPNQQLDGGSPKRSSEIGKRPPTYDACVVFARRGKSHWLRLAHDVSFITAYPCSISPHPLFFDYVYKIARMNQLLDIHNWAGVGGDNLNEDLQLGWAPEPEELGVEGSWEDNYDRKGAKWSFKELMEGVDKDTVLVIEAWGVEDNECMARAWCSHWGLNAVVAVVGKTCLSCAVREAYAAAINVVIFVGRE